MVASATADQVTDLINACKLQSDGAAKARRCQWQLGLLPLQTGCAARPLGRPQILLATPTHLQSRAVCSATPGCTAAAASWRSGARSTHQTAPHVRCCAVQVDHLRSLLELLVRKEPQLLPEFLPEVLELQVCGGGLWRWAVLTLAVGAPHAAFATTYMLRSIAPGC